MVNVTCGTLQNRKNMSFASEATVRHCIEECGFSVEGSGGKWTLSGQLLGPTDFDRTLVSFGYTDGNVILTTLENKNNATG